MKGLLIFIALAFAEGKRRGTRGSAHEVPKPMHKASIDYSINATFYYKQETGDGIAVMTKVFADANCRYGCAGDGLLSATDFSDLISLLNFACTRFSSYSSMAEKMDACYANDLDSEIFGTPFIMHDNRCLQWGEQKFCLGNKQCARHFLALLRKLNEDTSFKDACKLPFSRDVDTSACLDHQEDAFMKMFNNQKCEGTRLAALNDCGPRKKLAYFTHWTVDLSNEVERYNCAIDSIYSEQTEKPAKYIFVDDDAVYDELCSKAETMDYPQWPVNIRTHVQAVQEAYVSNGNDPEDFDWSSVAMVYPMFMSIYFYVVYQGLDIIPLGLPRLSCEYALTTAVACADRAWMGISGDAYFGIPDFRIEQKGGTTKEKGVGPTIIAKLEKHDFTVDADSAVYCWEDYWKGYITSQPSTQALGPEKLFMSNVDRTTDPWSAPNSMNMTDCELIRTEPKASEFSIYSRYELPCMAVNTESPGHTSATSCKLRQMGFMESPVCENCFDHNVGHAIEFDAPEGMNDCARLMVEADF